MENNNTTRNSAKKVVINNYTAVSNTAIEDKDLSNGAFRLLAYILMLPPTWHFNQKGLATISGMSERAIHDNIKELKKQGYLIIKRLSRDERKAEGVSALYIINPSPKDNRPITPQNSNIAILKEIANLDIINKNEIYKRTLEEQIKIAKTSWIKKDND